MMIIVTDSGPSALPGRLQSLSTVSMKILLVARQAADAGEVHAALVGEGHTVVTCTDGDGAPCRGVSHFDDCPLESAVDIAVLTPSPNATRSLEEMGSICAARHRVGVIEIDMTQPGDRSIYDLADDAETAICATYADRVTEMLREAFPSGQFDVAVNRCDRDVRVRVTLGFTATPIMITAIADRARAGVRRHDRFATVIDVSVVQQIH